MPLERDSRGRTYIRHPNNQLTHYIHNSYSDPWKPHATILIQHGLNRHTEFWYHWIPVLAPVLVLAPSQSAATSVEEQRGLAREIRGARLEVPEGKGHEIYVTEAERCQEIFLDFLRNLER